MVPRAPTPACQPHDPRPTLIRPSRSSAGLCTDWCHRGLTVMLCNGQKDAIFVSGEGREAGVGAQRWRRCGSFGVGSDGGGEELSVVEDRVRGGGPGRADRGDGTRTLSHVYTHVHHCQTRSA
ncbi:hypothetical protein E2C01_000545 [Portunus trituberculatus]|uniref:Uncharacterized protein n=1 Tax=Portunus trituberculatus TaxID=210409 RepID=A0A5B7CHR1_PORTR|nr:hypothetical protein [Portunus trituberculatus]